METFYVILLIIVFGMVSGLSGDAILGYCLVKEMRRFEKIIKEDKDTSLMYKGEFITVKPLIIYHNGKDTILKCLYNDKVIKIESWDFKIF